MLRSRRPHEPRGDGDLGLQERPEEGGQADGGRGDPAQRPNQCLASAAASSATDSQFRWFN